MLLSTLGTVSQWLAHAQVAHISYIHLFEGGRQVLFLALRPGHELFTIVIF